MIGGMDARARSRLTCRIREEARRLGFSGVGVAPAGPLPAGDRFDTWLQAGMHGEMRYMERQADRRRNPSLVLPHVRSVLVLAMNYYTVAPHPQDPLTGIISRYARGKDYHAEIGNRLQALQEFILSQAPEAGSLWYVDTGPVAEKAWGAAGGLGWLGKHSNLIIRGQGSWLFLGVILLSLELDYDAPARNHCGTCLRCIQACPTQAIVAPYVVDARFCVSYLTIELRGPIPLVLRPLIGNRVFGCDDCQEACPWNRFAVDTPLGEFRPREGDVAPILASLVSITREQFRHRFAGTAVWRAGRDGFVRNVAVALGNSRKPEAVEPLAGALTDPSALVRAHAAWALGQIGTTEARDELTAARSGETDPFALEEIERAVHSATADERR